MKAKSFLIGTFYGYLLLILLLEIYFRLSQSPIAARLQIGGSLACVFFAWTAWQDYRVRKALHPLQLFSLGTLLRVGIGGVYSGVLIKANHEIALNTSGYIPVATRADSLFLMNIASILLVIGMSGKTSRYAQIDGSGYYQRQTAPRYSVFLLAVLVGWIFTMLNLKTGMGFGVAGVALRKLPHVAIFALTISALIQRKNRNFRLACVGAIILMELAFARGTQMRETYAFILLPVFLALVFGMSWRKAIPLAPTPQKIPIRPPKANRLILDKKKRYAIYICLLLLLVLLVGLVFPAATLVKHGRALDLSTGLRMVTQDFSKSISEVHKFPQEGIYALPHRLALIVVGPAIIIKFTKQSRDLPYDPAQTVLAGFIPRALWKSKPEISKGKWFAEYLDPGHRGSVSIAMTAPAELFWAYGWVGTFAGMLLMGWLVNKCWTQSLRLGLMNPFAILVIIYVSEECIRWFEASAATPISLMLLFFVMAILYSKFFPSRMRKTFIHPTQSPNPSGAAMPPAQGGNP